MGIRAVRHGHMLAVGGINFAMVLQVSYVQTSTCPDHELGRGREVHEVVVDEPARGTLSWRSCDVSFGMHWLDGPWVWIPVAKESGVSGRGG